MAKTLKVIGTCLVSFLCATLSAPAESAFASSAVQPRLQHLKAPTVPKIVSAVAGNAQVTVSFSPPASNGGSPITGYTVTASPGGATCTTATTSCAVTGLTNGTSYTFVVAATNAAGTSANSSPSSAVIPTLVADILKFGTNLFALDFTGSDLSNLSLVNADMRQAIMKNVNLQGADLTGALLAGVRSGGISGVPSMLPRNWSLINGYLIGPGANIEGAELSGQNLDNLKLSNANLAKANLTGSSFRNTDLSGVSFEAARLGGCNFSVTNAVMISSNLKNSVFEVCSYQVTLAESVNQYVGSSTSSYPDTYGYFCGYHYSRQARYGYIYDVRGRRTYTIVGYYFNYQGYGCYTGYGFFVIRYHSITHTSYPVLDAQLFGNLSGGISGSVTGLPSNWSLMNGYLVGPGADLTNANFSNVNLAGVNLEGVNLTGTNLTGVSSGSITGTPSALPTNWLLINGYLVGPGANLSGANLSGIDLTGANLTGVSSGSITGTPSALPTNWLLINGYLVGPGANLSGANLSGADLSGANLSGVDLTGANLTGVSSGRISGLPGALPNDWFMRMGYLIGPGANLSGANLSGANLAGSNFSDANLTGAVITGANISGVNFRRTNLSDVVSGSLMSNKSNGGRLDGIAGYMNGNPPNLLPESPQASPDSGYVTITNSGSTLYQGIMGFVAVSACSGDLSKSYNLEIAPGQSVSIVISSESSNVGGFNGGVCGTNTVNQNGVTFFLHGSFLSGTSRVEISFEISDRDLNYVLQGGSSTGVDLGDSIEVSQANQIFSAGSGVILPDNWLLINGYLVGPGANLSGANLSGANLSEVDLTGANLTGVSSGSITGTPSALPTNWLLINGYLVGPGANLANANLANTNLAGVDLAAVILDGANLESTNLTGANLNGVTMSGANIANCVFFGSSALGITTGGLIGIPSSMPTGFKIVLGYFIVI